MDLRRGNRAVLFYIWVTLQANPNLGRKRRQIQRPKYQVRVEGLDGDPEASEGVRLLRGLVSFGCVRMLFGCLIFEGSHTSPYL